MIPAGVEVPARIAALPVQDGYPVPWFVAKVDGRYDFRVIAPGKIEEAHKMKLCWVCGQPLGTFKAFVIGPMCAINRVSSEPPSHKDCAIFSAKACPFLANPERPRREGKKPKGTKEAAGHGIPRNPGVTLVWITIHYDVFPAERGMLFELGDCEEVLWFSRGRQATRAEVEESVNSGLPELEKMCQNDEDRYELERRRKIAVMLYPEA